MKMKLDGWKKLADISRGHKYGHVPGHNYHDVDVVVSRKEESFRCAVRETWGSAQGRDEEHGRKEAVARGTSVEEVIRSARGEAIAAGIGDENDDVKQYLSSALSLALDEALEALEVIEEKAE